MLLFQEIKYGLRPKPKKASVADLLIQAENYITRRIGPKRNQVNSQAQLAKKLGISKARLTQIMNLLKLAPEIKLFLKNLKESKLIHYFTEKKLRPIAKTKDHQEQIKKFEEIKQRLELKNQVTRWVV